MVRENRNRLVVWLAMLAVLPCPSAAQPQISPTQRDANAILSAATKLRALAIEAPTLIVRDLDQMPAGIFANKPEDQQLRSQVWSLFFTGSVLKAGGLRGDHPIVLFFNPLADVAVLQSCARNSNGELRCDHICAIPGESLAIKNGTMARRPVWIRSVSPIASLRGTARLRLSQFAARFPAESKGAYATICSTKRQAAAELRLTDLFQSVSKIRPRPLLLALQCASTGQPNCQKEKSSDVQTRHRLDALAKSKGGMSVAGAIRSQGHLVVLVVPRISAWQMAAITVSEKGHDKYSFESVASLAL